jgi:hypothetical protein
MSKSSTSSQGYDSHSIKTFSATPSIQCKGALSMINKLQKKLDILQIQNDNLQTQYIALSLRVTDLENQTVPVP